MRIYEKYRRRRRLEETSVALGSGGLASWPYCSAQSL